MKPSTIREDNTHRRSLQDRRDAASELKTSSSSVTFGMEDENELFHAFKQRGDSDTRRKVAEFLRIADKVAGRTTPSGHWYSAAETE